MDNEKNFGYLVVTVLSGIVISPIKNAIVNVYGERGNTTYLVQSGLTDNAGLAGPFRLSAYDENYNDPSIGTKPVKMYELEIVADGYYTRVKQNIPIFPDIVSQEYVNMLPSPDEEGKITINFNDTIYSGTPANNYFGGGEEVE